jgi:hypothetical protein
LGLTITSILFTWAGLAAAALGVKWGNAPAPGDALREAWIYVAIMALLAVGVAWPMFARSCLPRPSALWQGGGLLIGAIPSLVVAAFLSGTSVETAAATIGILVGVAVLAAGGLSGGRLGPALLAAWIAGGPVAAFIWQDFLGSASRAWIAVTPCIAISRAAGGGSLVTAWLVAIVHGAAGCALLARRPALQKDDPA